MPDIEVRPESAKITATAFAPTILVSSQLWNNWSRIAIEHEAEAWRARAAWKEGSLRNAGPEFHASLVCITSVAFTFQALHSTLAPLVDPAFDPKARAEWSQMRATIALACKPSGKWQQDFEWLFREARRSAVHFVSEQHQPLWHEGLRTNIAREVHIFCAEQTTRAVDLMMEVFRALFAPGLKRASGVGDWSHRAKHVLDELAALRVG